MPWKSEDESKKYWVPDVEPEKTEEWQFTQMGKSYLKPDGSRTGHPGWYFGNGAYASDEYFYYNYKWYTIVDDSRPDLENGKYIIFESPESEWEVFDTYKIRKTYKKYLHNKVEKPAFQFGQVVVHSYDYDEVNMTVSDNYSVSIPTDLEFEKNQFLNEVRTVRDFILKETDYIIPISIERGESLSQEFINYRQSLRDLPQQFDFNSLTEDDHTQILSISTNLKTGTYLSKPKLEDINISCFPEMSINYFS